ncbi:MAG: group III truncated hemoglobin [Acidimicrobiia bacterium]|nr:group III truncated hemoglobin [Acidimicrobiia bacterium]
MDGLPDLDSRTQIHGLVVDFYREIVFDDLLSHVFVEVAEVDWSAHIPKLVDYWCRVLLGQPGYDGAFLAAHRDVHDREPFTRDHFDRWYGLWVETVDARWCGPFADAAKAHAARLMSVLSHRLLDAEWHPPEADRSTQEPITPVRTAPVRTLPTRNGS